MALFKSENQPRKTAVVLGGGMAGLFAANVLADHFERVTVVERDDGSKDEWRPGVPQSRHVHVLLLRGVQILRRRFPGLEEELLDRGAPPLNWLKETAALAAGGWLPRFDLNLLGYSVSRSLLERQVREHLRRRDNIHFRNGYRVTNLCANSDNSRITGAVCVANGETDTLHADLVVDACGRASRLPRLLAEFGYPEPRSRRSTPTWATRRAGTGFPQAGRRSGRWCCLARATPTSAAGRWSSLLRTIAGL